VRKKMGDGKCKPGRNGLCQEKHEGLPPHATVEYDDPEIQAMSLLASILEPLDKDARNRVIDWAMMRFGDDPIGGED
jgi:hypothetical protein